jgi:hypothetical protein
MACVLRCPGFAWWRCRWSAACGLCLCGGVWWSTWSGVNLRACHQRARPAPHGACASLPGLRLVVLSLVAGALQLGRCVCGGAWCSTWSSVHLRDCHQLAGPAPHGVCALPSVLRLVPCSSVGAVPGQGVHLRDCHQRAGCHLMACALRCPPGGVARAVRVLVLPGGAVAGRWCLTARSVRVWWSTWSGVHLSGCHQRAGPAPHCVCASLSGLHLVALSLACSVWPVPGGVVAGALQLCRCVCGGLPGQRVHLRACHQRAGPAPMACALCHLCFAWCPAACARWLCGVGPVWWPGALSLVSCSSVGAVCWCLVVYLVRCSPEGLSPACKACPHGVCALPSVLRLVPCSSVGPALQRVPGGCVVLVLSGGLVRCRCCRAARSVLCVGAWWSTWSGVHLRACHQLAGPAPHGVCASLFGLRLVALSLSPVPVWWCRTCGACVGPAWWLAGLSLLPCSSVGAVPGQRVHLRACHQLAGPAPHGVSASLSGLRLVVLSLVAGALQFGRCACGGLPGQRVHLRACHQRAGPAPMVCALCCLCFTWWLCRWCLAARSVRVWWCVCGLPGQGVHLRDCHQRCGVPLMQRGQSLAAFCRACTA